VVNSKPTRRRFALAGVSLLSAAVIVALGLPGAGSAGAAASAPAGSWPSQLARPAKAACPHGQTLIAPTSGRTDALGVAHVTYKSDPGLVAAVPPRGLTAGKVTPALLADVGISTRNAPGSPARRRLVQEVLRLAQHQAAPEFCRTPASLTTAADQPLRSPAGGPPLKNAHRDGGNWGGYAVTEAEFGGPIEGVYGSWTVPRSLTSSAPSAESTWAGVGGGIGENGTCYDPNTNPSGVACGLIQAGSSMQTNEGYRSWYEAIGTSGCTAYTHFCGQYSNIDAIQPGDAMTAEVYWENTTSACFFLTDWTRSSGSWFVCTPVSIPYDHTSAEWVNESHLLSGYYYDSPGTVDWSEQLLTGTFDNSGSWNSPFSGSFEALVMDTGSRTTGTACGQPAVLSVPVGATNSAGEGSSQIVTCSVSGIDSP
jgi:Peptidase A4 family